VKTLWPLTMVNFCFFVLIHTQLKTLWPLTMENFFPVLIHTQVKTLWPLTMVTVPVIWVFPWELITGGFKSRF
jgi:hypothetical protein